MTRILYVDDEPDLREIAALALGLDPGLEVRTCSSGGEALVEALAFRPDLVLLDVMMPGMDGPTTLARLRETPDTAAIPVAFITARVQPHEIRSFLELSAVGVISKPFDPMALAGEVRSLLAEAQA